jgi:hypothetical protein
MDNIMLLVSILFLGATMFVAVFVLVATLMVALDD